MNALQRAWLDVRLALATFHAEQECEAQVAYWVIEGNATVADLREARERSGEARAALTDARSRYKFQSSLVAAASVSVPVAGRRAAPRSPARHIEVG